MKRIKQLLFVLISIILVVVLIKGSKFGKKLYTKYETIQALDHSELGTQIGEDEKRMAIDLKQGDIVSKKLLHLSEIEPVWNTISEGGNLKSEMSFVKQIDVYSIVYKSDSLLVNGFIVEPKKDGNYPVVIFNRGGNQYTGSYAKYKTLMSALYATGELAAEGYVVLATCYRENDEFGGNDINDVLSLTKTAHHVNKANANRIGMMGWSRGGMMTYLSLKNTNILKTAVVVNGPTELASLNTERPEMESVCEKLIPNYENNRSEELRNRSAIYWTDELSKNTSLFILCGSEDVQVNPNQAHQIDKKLNEIGYKHTFKEYKTDHKFTGKIDALYTDLSDWFGHEL